MKMLLKPTGSFLNCLLSSGEGVDWEDEGMPSSSQSTPSSSGGSFRGDLLFPQDAQPLIDLLTQDQRVGVQVELL